MMWPSMSNLPCPPHIQEPRTQASQSGEWRRRAWGYSLLIGVCFSAAYGQAGLYYSNQNQYFLHGIAAVGEPSLQLDWLTQTADPTPLFSLLVEAMAWLRAPWLFHVQLALLAGVYLGGLTSIFFYLVGPEAAGRRWPLFLTAMIAIHSALGRWLSYQWFGLDYPWYLQAGVAGQYVLGAMLQPSVFGVLLVAAVGFFVHGRRMLAALAVAAAATVHPTYLLPGAMLTAGFVAARLTQKDIRGAFVQAIVTLALVTPVVAFVLCRFGPTSAETYREAQRILVEVRIPHHCRPDLWLDFIAGLQIAWMALALGLTWRTCLFPILATSLGIAAVLTTVQWVTGSDALALLFPWRISSVLMPIATAVALARLVGVARWPLDNKQGYAFAVMLALAAAGLWITLTGRAFRVSDDEQSLYDFVRGSVALGDVYLLPVAVPNLAATTRGSLSSDFKPPAAKRADSRIVPIDLQRFRLATGAPIFVDFKAIPYKDVDVLEWRQRLTEAERWQAAFAAGKIDDALPELRQRGITHIVVPAGQPLIGDGVREIHADGVYRVYRIVPA